MDATTAAAKAVAPSADVDNAPSPQRTAAPKPVSGQEEQLPAAVADLAPPITATASTTSAECGGEDEQVEKFYSLLANIRAVRGMYAGGSSDADAITDDTASEVCGGVRKRSRWAEQPWRPTFRMEDFEEAPGGSASKKGREDEEGAATSRRLGKETTDEAADGESDDA